MLRELQPSTKNTTHTRTLPTKAELKLWHELQSALVAAAMKVLDSKIGDSITDVQVQRGNPNIETSWSHPDLLRITLTPCENDDASGYGDKPIITTTMKLTLPLLPNPDYDPEQEQEYTY